MCYVGSSPVGEVPIGLCSSSIIQLEASIVVQANFDLDITKYSPLSSSIEVEALLHTNASRLGLLSAALDAIARVNLDVAKGRPLSSTVVAISRFGLGIPRYRPLNANIVAIADLSLITGIRLDASIVAEATLSSSLTKYTSLSSVVRSEAVFSSGVTRYIPLSSAIGSEAGFSLELVKYIPLSSAMGGVAKFSLSVTKYAYLSTELEGIAYLQFRSDIPLSAIDDGVVAEANFHISQGCILVTVKCRKYKLCDLESFGWSCEARFTLPLPNRTILLSTGSKAQVFRLSASITCAAVVDNRVYKLAGLQFGGLAVVESSISVIRPLVKSSSALGMLPVGASPIGARLS